MDIEHIPRANISAANISSVANISKEEANQPVLRCDPERGSSLLFPMELISLILENLPFSSLLQWRAVSKNLLRVASAAPNQAKEFFENAQIDRSKYKSGEVVPDQELIDLLSAKVMRLLPEDKVAGLRVLGGTLEYALTKILFEYTEGWSKSLQGLLTVSYIHQITSIHGLSDADKIKLICARTAITELGLSHDAKAVELLFKEEPDGILVDYMDAVLNSNLTEEAKREILGLRQEIGRPEDDYRVYRDVVTRSTLSEAVKQSLFESVVSVDDSFRVNL